MPRSKSIPWARALDLFHDHMVALNMRPLTVSGYQILLRRFLAHGGQQHAPYGPAEVTLEHLREYQVGLFTGATSPSRRGLGAETVAAATTTLRTFFRFLAAEELIPKDPTLRLEQPQSPPRAPGGVLSVSEARRLLAAADTTTHVGLRDRAAVELLYATGLRRSELLALDLADVDHAEREVVVRDGKGGKGRVLPITRSAYAALQAYLERGRPAFLTSGRAATTALLLARPGKPMEPPALKKTLGRLARGAGIKKRLTPHTLRRSFATHLLKAGASLRHIQVLLGHSSLQTTAAYLSLDRTELRKEVLTRHPRERFEV